MTHFPSPGTEAAEEADPRVRAIAEAARNLVLCRDLWLHPPATPGQPGLPEAELRKLTLTTLYNKRPEWLADAHRALDRAVFAAHGWRGELSKQEMLARLLALNHERAGAAR